MRCALSAAVAFVIVAAGCAEERREPDRRATPTVDPAAPPGAEVEAQVAQVRSRMATVAALGRQAKAELDKVYRSSHAYSLAITTAPVSPAQQAKLEALPRVTVGAVSVGYEQIKSVSLDGTSDARFFRATWQRGDQIVIVGFQTGEALDAAAFGQLVPLLVPAVERVLPRTP